MAEVSFLLRSRRVPRRTAPVLESSPDERRIELKQLKSIKKTFDQPSRDLGERMSRSDEYLQKHWRQRHLRSRSIQVREAIREASDFRQAD